MTVLVVGGLALAIAGVYLVVLADVQKWFEIARGRPFDHDESRG